ncbi:906_t:CDS:1, partial [Acaulospora colombiana]
MWVHSGRWFVLGGLARGTITAVRTSFSRHPYHIRPQTFHSTLDMRDSGLQYTISILFLLENPSAVPSCMAKRDDVRPR